MSHSSEIQIPKRWGNKRKEVETIFPAVIRSEVVMPNPNTIKGEWKIEGARHNGDALCKPRVKDHRGFHHEEHQVLRGRLAP